MTSFGLTTYTGENRCWPCTVTNLALAAVVSAVLFLFSPIAAAVFLAVGVLLVAFVGYLIPGTPALTRRYFPTRVLSWFGKAPSAEVRAATGAPSTATAENGAQDVERGVDWLIDVGALSTDGDDTLTLDTAFEDRWMARIESLQDDENAQVETFARIVDVDPTEVTVDEIAETGALSVHVEGHDISQWMSRAAFISDLAANDTLATLDATWETSSLAERHELLVGLRQFLHTCPLCSAALVEETESIESCCWTTNAVTARCEECDSRMYVVAHA